MGPETHTAVDKLEGGSNHNTVADSTVVAGSGTTGVIVHIIIAVAECRGPQEIIIASCQGDNIGEVIGIRRIRT